MSQPTLRKNQPIFEFKDDQDEIESLAEIIEQEPDFSEKTKRTPHGRGSQSYQSNLQDVKTNFTSMYGNTLQVQQNPKSPKSARLVQKTQQLVEGTSTIVFTVIISLIVNIVLTYPLIILKSIYTFLTGFIYPCQKKCTIHAFVKKFINPIVQIIFASSVLCIVYFTITGIHQTQRDFYGILFFDAFFLFFTKILVFSIIKLTKQQDLKLTWKNVCSIFDPGSQNGLVLDLIDKQRDSDIYMDVSRIEDNWKQEYLDIMNSKLEVDLQIQRFNTIQTDIKNPLTLELIGYQFLQGQNQILGTHFVQFVTTQLLSLAKIFSCLIFIYINIPFDTDDIFYLLAITLFNINEIYCFNILLSNQDLRRKTIMSNSINDCIKFTDIEIENDYTKLLDVTSCISLETWDNSRRAIYLFFQGMYKKFEMCYCCIFIYYLFILNIILAKFFEFDLFFDKNSVFLNPIIIISSIFNFLILNVFLLFRFYFGSKYNETIEEAGDNIDTLIGIYQDLIQMYDYNFQQKQISQATLSIVSKNKMQPLPQRTQVMFEDPEDAQLMSRQLTQDPSRAFMITCYDLIIAKIKFLSRFYIDRRLEFLGKVYSNAEEKNLQQKMLKNNLKSFQRIKSQIEIDSKQICYKVLNLLKLDFQESLLTLSVGLISIAPQIVPAFISMFKGEALNPSS
ncbi:transmembrane protein, putative (macronuclear) [Tetrahymena thermophila SB210]|uniref:Transmembrane protein, putative n=1 Tax=Tetrahymena thermophila (strain SB210) TaxID=312017 RepID=I7LT21_TETTS|nr:transmembrane protein, putative [Tetrahymena thermophila SB210]EAR84095.2 transmembrane protein, putative [Tetrahymena thermophila SB210]|eukprot:XP_001031758.2 transmembrane protein, putative [Tetrahymena thermophila SB210]